MHKGEGLEKRKSSAHVQVMKMLNLNAHPHAQPSPQTAEKKLETPDRVMSLTLHGGLRELCMAARRARSTHEVH